MPRSIGSATGTVPGEISSRIRSCSTVLESARERGASNTSELTTPMQRSRFT
jgi:hypothetical protein